MNTKNPRLMETENPVMVGQIRVVAYTDYEVVRWQLEDQLTTEDEYREVGPFGNGKCEHCRQSITVKNYVDHRPIWIHEATGRIRCENSRIWRRTGKAYGENVTGYIMAEMHWMSFEEYQSTSGDPLNYQGVFFDIQEMQLGVCGHDGCHEHRGWETIDSMGIALYIDEGWVDSSEKGTELDPEDIPAVVLDSFGLTVDEEGNVARAAG